MNNLMMEITPWYNFNDTGIKSGDYAYVSNISKEDALQQQHLVKIRHVNILLQDFADMEHQKWKFAVLP